MRSISSSPAGNSSPRRSLTVCQNAGESRSEAPQLLASSLSSLDAVGEGIQVGERAQHRARRLTKSLGERGIPNGVNTNTRYGYAVIKLDREIER
jgi:hypothetical protein